MNAAEKLRALAEDIQRDKDYQDESVVLRALPFSVAVVEAAAVLSNFLENERETFEPPSDLMESGFAAVETSGDYDRLEQLGDTLLAALAALEEALT